MFNNNQTFSSVNYINSIKSVNPIVAGLLLLLVLLAIPVIIVLFIAFSVLSTIIRSVRSLFVKPIANSNTEPNITVKNVTDQSNSRFSKDAEYVEYEIIED